MFKKFLPIAALVISVQFNAFSQVGIGTTSPATTLDVKGAPTNSTIADGMIAPTLTGNELKAKDAVYGSDHRGTIVYVSAAVTSASAKTTNVNSTGYFYYDGSVWQRIVTGSSTDNIYTTNGTIGSGRTVNVTNTVNFDAGTLFLDGTNNRIGIGTSTPTEKLDLTGNVKFSGALMPNNTAGTAGQVLVSNGAGSAPNWVNVPNMTYGDIKTGIQTVDHGGWVKLDGRVKSTLSADQQIRATALGIVTNLPDATNSCLIQNGTALGSVSGSNSKTITQANLPNINLTAASVTAGTPSGTIGGGGAHSHNLSAFIRYRTGVTGGPTPGVFSDGASGNLVSTDAEPNHTHTFSGSALPGHTHNVPLGGSGTALDITPKSLSVNTFIYLGN
jgi:hypothetical protein